MDDSIRRHLCTPNAHSAGSRAQPEPLGGACQTQRPCYGYQGGNQPYSAPKRAKCVLQDAGMDFVVGQQLVASCLAVQYKNTAHAFCLD
jgi:hypothetical protein